MKDTEEIPDSQRTVLEIRFKKGNPLYLANMSFMAVGNPYNATRYPPLDEKHPGRAESQAKDKKWMESEYDAVIKYVPFLKAYEEWKAKHTED